MSNSVFTLKKKKTVAILFLQSFGLSTFQDINITYLHKWQNFRNMHSLDKYF